MGLVISLDLIYNLTKLGVDQITTLNDGKTVAIYGNPYISVIGIVGVCTLYGIYSYSTKNKTYMWEFC